jgi:hypothetical protein
MGWNGMTYRAVRDGGTVEHNAECYFWDAVRRIVSKVKIGRGRDGLTPALLSAH